MSIPLQKHRQKQLDGEDIAVGKDWNITKKKNDRKASFSIPNTHIINMKSGSRSAYY